MWEKPQIGRLRQKNEVSVSWASMQALEKYAYVKFRILIFS